MTYVDYLLKEAKRLAGILRYTDHALSIIPEDIQGSLAEERSFQKKHLSGICQIARKAGATEEQISAVIQDEEKIR